MTNQCYSMLLLDCLEIAASTRCSLLVLASEGPQTLAAAQGFVSIGRDDEYIFQWLGRPPESNTGRCSKTMWRKIYRVLRLAYNARDRCSKPPETAE
ncbi:hypothetical protein V5799_016674 [Amblyomma americanum]|uniref:Uncharacterized protein n=1 Tax=Amblyomma americanum TaxID=6943 RepID=A0AAQ4F4G3_AMBAM